MLATDEPVSQWHQVAAFDTAKECMQEKLWLEGLFWDRAEDAEGTAWSIALDAVGASRCVPAKYVSRPEARQRSTGSSDAQPISGWRAPW